MGNAVIDEYISREAAISAITGVPTDAHYPDWYAAILAKLPAADVAPVVRCKDCIYNIDGLCFSRTSFKTAFAVEPDNFCSWGEAE